MKQILVWAGVVLALWAGGKTICEWRASSMVELAAAMGEEKRYEEAIAKLDFVQNWLGWTDAARDVMDLRKKLSRKQALAEEARREEEWERQREIEEDKQRHEREMMEERYGSPDDYN